MTAIPTYLVSGDADIKPSHANLRRSGRRVRHSDEVDVDAKIAITPGRHFIVVAHGNERGTSVFWKHDAWPSSRRWLFVGMSNPPAGARVYLYCCYAGKRVPRYLKKCEAFGHTHEVPIPVGASTPIVLDFFDEVEEVLKTDFHWETWRQTLGTYVNRVYAEEVLNPTSPWSTAVLAILRKSLGFADPEDEA